MHTPLHGFQSSSLQIHRLLSVQGVLRAHDTGAVQTVDSAGPGAALASTPCTSIVHPSLCQSLAVVPVERVPPFRRIGGAVALSSSAIGGPPPSPGAQGSIPR